MGKIYCIMGKSASGKDTLFKKLLLECPKMKKMVLYTTRPMREGETDGVEYHFVKPEDLDRFEKEGKLVEKRIYNTVHGPWIYATVDNKDLKLASRNYLVIGTLESYVKIRDYFGQDNVVPILITLDDGIRLQRALNRENVQNEPHYREMCRRYLADEEDFSEEKIREAGISKRYVNEDLSRCFAEICAVIKNPKEG
ncbi:MAG: guanylate kinase [Lachnospiraceae bacterium]|nr:guanylate kinase [Lachnospiraceae bacterium]